MAPTVVLLHAFPLDRRVWDGVVGAVAESGWDVVVPDLRGFGESAYGGAEPDDEPSLSFMARDVLDILDRLDVASAVVGGISMGGYVVMEIARQDPARLAGVILVDTKATADAQEARDTRLQVAEHVLSNGSTEALARTMPATLLGATTHASRPELVERVAAWVRESEPEGVAWAQRAMAARPDSHEALAALAVPGLLVWGTEDVMSPRGEQDSMVAAMRDARLVEVPDAGHLSPVEQPDAVARAIVDFLRDVRRLPAST